LKIEKKNYTPRATHTLSQNNSWPAILFQPNMKKAASVSRSPIHHKKTTKKNRRDRGLPTDTRRETSEKGYQPGCYIES
jgi:hypothetical protein